MKKLALALLIASPLMLFAAGGAVTPAEQFTATTSPVSAITQRVYGKPIYLTGLLDGCLSLVSNQLTSSGSACGSGGGGGSPGGLNTQIQFNDGGSAFGGNAAATFNKATGLTTLGNLLLTGSSTFQNLTFRNATGTQATTTNFFSTNLFGGTANMVDLTVTNAIAGSITGNAGTATKLATGRTVAITGDLTYTSPSFDGSGNVTAAGTLATVNGNVGSFGTATQVPQITFNGKGLATGITNVTITPAASSITGGAALTKTDDTNVTLTLGGSPSTALLAATSLTLGWTGTLADSRVADNLTISGGTVDNSVIGGTTKAAGSFTNLLASASSTLQNFTGVNATTTQATTTNLSVGTLFRSGTTDGCGTWAGGVLGSTGSACGSGSGGSSYPFPLAGNATSSTVGFNLGLIGTGSSTIQNLNMTTATATNATTTNFFATTASTSALFGANLSTCNGASSALIYNAVTGLFGCNTISAGSAASTTLLTDNNGFSGLNTFTDLKLVTRSTTTNATTTNLFSTTASSTNLFTSNFGVGSSTPMAPVVFSQSSGLLNPVLIIDGVYGNASAEMALNRASGANKEANIDFNTNGVEKWQMGMQDRNPASDDFEFWDGADNPIWAVSAANNDFMIGTTTGYAELTVWGDAGTGNIVQFATAASTTAFVVTNGGNIGIGGTTTPYAPLSISQAAGLLTTAVAIDGVANSAGAEMAFNRANTGSTEANIDFNTAGVEFWQIGMQNNASNDFELWDGNDNPAFTIKTATNNTGIGTTSPYARLTAWGAGTGNEKVFEVVNNASTSEFSVTDAGLTSLVNLLASGSSTLQNFTARNATTSQATTTAFADSALASALIITNSAGTLANYTAQACTNQFVRGLSALGVPTCNSVAIGTDVSGLGANVATFLGTPTSANFAAAVTGETGTGNVVFSADPVFTGTPTFQGFLSQSSTTISALTVTNGTTTNATSTNLFATTLNAINASTTLATSTIYALTGTANVPVLGFYSAAANSIDGSTASTWRFGVNSTGQFSIASNTPWASVLSLGAPAGTAPLFAIGSTTSNGGSGLVASVAYQPYAAIAAGTSTPDAEFHFNASTTAAGLFANILDVSSSTKTQTTSLFKITQNGQQMSSTTVPIISTCGTGPTFYGDDSAMSITTGTAATACTATFGTAYVKTPSCVVTNRSMSITSAMTYTVSKTAVTVSQAVGLAGDVLDIICRQTGNGS